MNFIILQRHSLEQLHLLPHLVRLSLSSCPRSWVYWDPVSMNKDFSSSSAWSLQVFLDNSFLSHQFKLLETKTPTKKEKNIGGTITETITITTTRRRLFLCKLRFMLLLLSRFSRVRLCATPWTAAYQAPPSLGFSRQEHWSGLPFPLQCMKVKTESEVAQSCPTLSDPMDCSLPGSSIHGIFQATVLECVAIAFSI